MNIKHLHVFIFSLYESFCRASGSSAGFPFKSGTLTCVCLVFWKQKRWSSWSSWSSCIASVARFLHPWNKKQTETWRRSISHFMFFSVCPAVFWLAACCDRRHKDCSILSLFVDFQLFSESVFVIWFLFEAAGRLANVPHRLRDVFIYSSGFRLQQMMRYGS